VRQLIDGIRHVTRHEKFLTDSRAVVLLQEIHGPDLGGLALSSVLDIVPLDLGKAMSATTRQFTSSRLWEKAGVSEKTLRYLEAGRDSTVEALLRILKALDYLQGLDLLVPEASTNPLLPLRQPKTPQRARHPRKRSSEK
jgi:hypothetical protein